MAYGRWRRSRSPGLEDLGHDRAAAIVHREAGLMARPMGRWIRMLRLIAACAGITTMAVVIAGCGSRIPSWSKDGRSIGVAYGGQVYLVAADGSGTRRLTTGPSELSDSGLGGPTAWSPDDREVVFG